MKRRDFIQLLASAVPAALILPELIVPKRTFFLPPAAGWLPPIERSAVKVGGSYFLDAVAGMNFLVRMSGEPDVNFRARILKQIQTATF